MATYSNIGIKLITTGDESGTWGTSTNTNFSDVLDEAIAGAVTYNISSDADFTLTVSDGTSSDARHAVIKFTSTTLTATRTCTFAPNDLQKTWVVINATTGGQSLTFKQGSAGATVTVPNGESAIIYSDGGGASAGAITRVLDSFTNTKITTGSLSASGNITSGGTLQALSTVQSSSGADLSLNANGANRDVFLKVNGTTLMTVQGSTSNVGIGTTTPANALEIARGAGVAGGASLRGNGNSAAAEFFVGQGSGSDAFLYNRANATMIFGTNNATRMTLDSSGNLGIGTTSPAYKLDVDRGASNGVVARFGRSSGQFAHIYADTASVYFGSDNGANTAWQFNESSDYLAAWTAGSERLRIDSSGNLGLGVTPSGWDGTAPGLVFGTSAKGSLSYAGGATSLGDNFYRNSIGYRYVTTAAVSLYQASAGTHAWYNAPSGTAGNAITFTQAMTLDASGRLLIGATSSQGNGSRLQISGNTQCFGSTGGNALLCSTSYFNTNSSGFEVAKLDVSTGANIYEGVFQFYTKDSGGTMAERARITAAGEFLVGTTTNPIGSTAVFSHTGAGIGVGVGDIATPANRTGISFRSTTENRIAYDASGYLTFVNGTTERARFTGANFLVGTTTDVSGLNGVISDVSGNVRAIPQSGSDKTTSYTLVKSDVGKFIGVGSGGSITVPDATFATGDVVSIFNNTTGNVTLTMTITTAYIGGTNTDKATITLATRGVATILFISGTVCVVNGNVS